MDKRTLLGRMAMRGALDVRKRAGCAYDTPICIYDLTEKVGISLWFQGGGSFGGMYSKTAKVILVPSLRPAPRQAFTCAHELGHWYYGHGSKLDAYKDGEDFRSDDGEEFLADLFAGYLLMPPGAVTKTFNVRKIDPNNCSPKDFYRVVSQLGVGYTTLLSHMHWSQKNLNKSSYDKLKKYSPKAIRADLLHYLDNDPGHFIIADEQWGTVPIDLQVGQVALVPPRTLVRGANIEIVRETVTDTVIMATHPGISSIECTSGWTSFVRVARKDFEGRSIYRHLEEVEDE